MAYWYDLFMCFKKDKNQLETFIFSFNTTHQMNFCSFGLENVLFMTGAIYPSSLETKYI